LVEIIFSEIVKSPGPGVRRVLSLEDNVSMLEIVCRKIYLKCTWFGKITLLFSGKNKAFISTIM
jgi:hypothetical protein